MNKPWFAPKRVGYGASLPISWEGWVVLAVFLLATWALLYFSQQLASPVIATLVRVGGMGVLIAVVVVIARGKTEGGWRWRSGKD